MHIKNTESNLIYHIFTEYCIAQNVGIELKLTVGFSMPKVKSVKNIFRIEQYF